MNIIKYNERIRDIRVEHCYTQQHVADLLHVGQRTYSDYENGKTRIPVDSLLILAKYYNVSMDYITGASNQKEEYPKC
ncbi:MAG: helix-turn-helix domain-containing protein [Clostridiales bacterium]|nr:helix-turn-helix domain-containing protein [Clostridiales bacterium]